MRLFTRLLLLSAVLIPGMLFAIGNTKEKTYADAWAEAGITLTHSDANSVRISFSIERFTLRDVVINGENVTEIELPGVFLPGEAGAPNLPGMGRYIALPVGAKPSLRIVGMRTEIIPGLSIAPAPEIPLETEDGLSYRKNEAIYGNKQLYPAQPVKLGEVTQIRGVDAVMLGITPFQYDPQSGDLTVIRDISLEITFENGNGYFGDDRLRSRWWDPILRDAFLNYTSLPPVDYGSKMAGTQNGYEYLIISPDNAQFLAWADSLKQFRTLQGIKTGVVTLTDIGSNTTAAIESYINNAYNTWTIPPAAVLLMADYGTGGTTSNGIHSPVYNNYCISDHIYADVNGNHMADIAFARMTAQSETQLAIMVQKVLDYERNPPTLEAFYDNPITAMGWQTERWFQLCSETVNGFLEFGLGKSPVRENAIYSGSPGGNWSTATNTATVVNYFGPSGLGYIPATSSHLNDWGGNATRVNNDINSGAFILQHRDHGFEGGWGEPDYGTSDLSGLNNNNLPFVFSVNCLTGKFNHSSETFAEAFHRYPKRALGIIAATEVSYSFVNDAYVWGLYDNMWPEFMPLYGASRDHNLMPAFGNVAGKLFLQQSSWPYNTSNKEVTYYLFHHHGDAFTTVYSEVPQYLTVVHNPVLLAGVSTFTVSADSGALVSLTNNGEILFADTANGTPQMLPITPLLPGEFLTVTVTKQDYYRYSQKVQVIPPAGPYVIKDDVLLNDANQNGQADYGEEIWLSLQVKNVGIAMATGVSLTLACTDPHIQIMDSTAYCGDIASDSLLLQSNAFHIKVADSLQDGHKALFSLTATDGTDLWQSGFSLTLNAPVLELPSIVIIDTNGNNNGLPDPGETVSVHVMAGNSGGAPTQMAKHQLVTTSPWLQISGSPYHFTSLAAGASSPGVFTVTVDPTTPDGTNLDLISHLSTGPYATDRVFFHPVGEANEDFETGNLTKFNWVTGGSANWFPTTQQPYEGLYSARSGYIGNNTTTWLQITLDILVNDTISFYRKVSSEASYDFLEFYIDNVKLGSWSGNQAWAKVSYPVSAGQHTFKWVYDKDWYATGGSDAAWIDWIQFPPIQAPGTGLEVRATALTTDVCEGTATTLYAIATGAGAPTSLQWSPASNLSDPTIYNPQAQPLQNTTYTVVANGGGQTSTDSVMLYVRPAPQIALPVDTAICADLVLNLNAGIPGGVNYQWNPDMGNNAVVQLDSAGIGFGEVTYAVTATDQYGCEDSRSIKITFVDCAGLEEMAGRLGLEVYPNPSNGFVFVRNTSGMKDIEVQLLGIQGALLRSWKQSAGEDLLRLDLNGLAQGTYLLQFRTSQGSETHKIILY